MNDQLTPPIPTPNTQPGLQKKQFVAIMVLLTIVALLIGVIIGPNDKSSAPGTTSTVAPATTAYVPPSTYAPVGGDYSAFVNYVYDNSSLASQLSSAKIREYGDTICTALDSGNSIQWLVTYLSDSGNTAQDNELYASIIFGAITYVCPRYQADLNAYLSTIN